MFEVVTGLVLYPDFKNGNIKAFQLQNTIKESFKELIERCWSKEPDDRPTFSELFKMLSNKDDEFDSKYFFDDHLNSNKQFIMNLNQNLFCKTMHKFSNA